MSLTIALVAVLVIAVTAGLFARHRASGLRGGGARLNSLPNYHALYVGLWAALPALLALAIWAPVQGQLVDQAVLASPAGQKLPDFEMQRETILGIRNHPTSRPSTRRRASNMRHWAAASPS
jgi:phosphate transport system permease protein